jgi:cytochrome P450
MAKASFPPGPRDWVPFRLGARFYRDPVAFLLETARTYGDIAHVKAGFLHVVLLSHPDLIQDVLVTHNHNFTKTQTQIIRILGNGLLGSEGDFHLRQRRALQPLFLRERVAHHAEDIVALTLRRSSAWQSGTTIDFYEEMLELTQAIVGKTLFDSDVEAESGQVRGLLVQAAQSGHLIHKLPLARLLEKLPFRGVRRFQEAQDQLHALVQGMIDEHRGTGKERGDVLSLMLRLREEQGEQDILTDEQIRDQTLTLFVAGHETTATALAWTWYLLAHNPEAEARLHDELARVLAGRPPTAADLPQLHYTEMVFAEAMRLFPPIYAMARKAIQEHPLAGYVFPAGTLFLMSQYVMHHDPRFFPDPERFDPERMSHEARAKLPRFAYFPFGGGPRQCIGEAFAWVESVLMIATLAQHWRFRWTSDKPVETVKMITLQPRGGLPMQLERRD